MITHRVQGRDLEIKYWILLSSLSTSQGLVHWKLSHSIVLLMEPCPSVCAPLNRLTCVLLSH